MPLSRSVIRRVYRGVPWEDSGIATPSSIDSENDSADGCRQLRRARAPRAEARCEWRARGLALSARDLLEPPQGLDVIVEVQDAVHGVQHHHVSAESTPAVRRSRPALGV